MAGSGDTTTAGPLDGGPIAWPEGSFHLDILSADTNVSLAIRGSYFGSNYEVLSSDQLGGVWRSEGYVTGASNADWTPATVALNGRTNLFLWARRCDGACPGVLPQSWLLASFNDTSVDPYGDYDGDGVSNYDEWLDGSDPDKVRFSIQFRSDRVASTTVTGTVEVVRGVPFYMAGLIDSTNFDSAAWVPYSSEFSILLGAVDGKYNVYLGLKGRAPDSLPSWTMRRLTLDRQPPAIVITNPVSSVVTQPMIQLQGYCPKALARISYDLTNSKGLQTNQAVLVLDQFFDTIAREFTSNAIQAFDVPLALGDNLITIHATDLAGNVTTTNFTYTLDYSRKTNPPALVLYWPKDGTRICGTNFTWRGHLDDFTAAVNATIADAIGNTNIFRGLVERDGTFWVQDLPLTDGTNALTLTATDAAGNSSTTNISVVKGTMVLTVDPVPDSDLSRSKVIVTGTINATDRAVWVNGVRATNQDMGTWVTWAATNVPVTPGGTAVLEVRAIPLSDNGGNGSADWGPATYANCGNPTSGSADDCGPSPPEKPPRLYVEEYFEGGSDSGKGQWTEFTGSGPEVCWGNFDWGYEGFWRWHDGVGGSGTWPSSSTGSSTANCDHSRSWGPCTETVGWPATEWEHLTNGTQVWDGDCNWAVYDETTIPPPIVWEHCELNDFGSWAETHHWYEYEGVFEDSQQSENFCRSAQVKVKLFTGGKALPGAWKLWLFSAYANELVRNDAGWHIGYGLGADVPPEQIAIGSLGYLDSDRILAVVLPDGDPDVTPRVDGKQYVQFAPYVTPFKPRTRTACLTPNPPDRTTIGVGEQVSCGFAPDFPDPYHATWTTTGGSVSPQVGGSAVLTAPSNAVSTSVEFHYKQAKATFPFSVLAPDGVLIGAPNCVSPPSSPGAWMQVRLTLTPTNVSFGNIYAPMQVMEVNTNVSGATGYYLTHPPGKDPQANVWHPVGCDNLIMVDNAFRYGLDPLGSGGRFTWPMYPVWKVGDGPTNSLSGWTDQSFQLDADGTMTVRKFNHSVARSPSQPCGSVQ